MDTMNHSRSQILEDYQLTEADVQTDEKGDFILVEKYGSVESENGTVLDVPEGEERIDLPPKPIFKDSNDLFMENQEKILREEEEEREKAIFDEKTGEYLGQRK